MKLVNMLRERIRKLKMHYYDYQMSVLSDLIEYYEVEGKTKKVCKCVNDYNKYAKKYMKCMKVNAD